MATAVLLPHDCLEYSRHRTKHHHHGTVSVVSKPEHLARSRRNILQGTTSRGNFSEHLKQQQKPSFAKSFVRDSDSGLLPLPGHGESLPINIPRKGIDASKRSKTRRPANQWDGCSSLKSSPEASVPTILQRPKHKDSAEVSLYTKHDQYTFKYVKKSDFKSNDHHTGVCDVNMARTVSMGPGVLGSVPKPHEYKAVNTVYQRGFVNTKSSGLLAAPNHVVGAADATVESVSRSVMMKPRHSNSKSDGFVQLRRTSTDPVTVKQLLDHCRSDGSQCGSKERWAGPAYSSSPSPSSLPLPKFFHPSLRMAGRSPDPLNADQSTSLSSSLPSLTTLPNENMLDVAVATRSLRKMLNIDPCN